MSSPLPSLASILEMLDDVPADGWEGQLALESGPPVPAPRPQAAPRPLVVTWNAEQRSHLRGPFVDPYEGLPVLGGGNQISVQTVMRPKPTTAGVKNSQLGRALTAIGAERFIDL